MNLQPDRDFQSTRTRHQAIDNYHSGMVWASTIGACFFGEILDVWTAVGGLIIFLSGCYIVFRESQFRQPAKGIVADQ
ncbi:MAG: hypothetical protein AB8B63_04235 [Granulosicoccus sp.]